MQAGLQKIRGIGTKSVSFRRGVHHTTCKAGQKTRACLRNKAHTQRKLNGRLRIDVYREIRMKNHVENPETVKTKVEGRPLFNTIRKGHTSLITSFQAVHSREEVFCAANTYLTHGCFHRYLSNSNLPTPHTRTLSRILSTSFVHIRFTENVTQRTHQHREKHSSKKNLRRLGKQRQLLRRVKQR